MDSEIDALFVGSGEDQIGLSFGDSDVQRIEEHFRAHIKSQPAQTFGEHQRQSMHALRDAAESVGTMVHGIHAGHHGQQHLGCTNVTRRFFTPDMLFACLQG
jgi:hypothetical protein